VTTRILVVDDEPMLRALISRALRDEGYEVVEAENGLAGLEAARSAPQPFDLVITDNRMRGMSGPELAEQLQKLHPTIPILHLSGNHVANPGQYPTLFKPFNRSDLLQRDDRPLVTSRSAPRHCRKGVLRALAPGEKPVQSSAMTH
jgi:CheY-like chemotaxis protein